MHNLMISGHQKIKKSCARAEYVSDYEERCSPAKIGHEKQVWGGSHILYEYTKNNATADPPEY